MLTGFLLDDVESREFKVFYKEETRKEIEELNKIALENAVEIIKDLKSGKEVQNERYKVSMELWEKKIPEKQKEIIIIDNLAEELKTCKDDTFYYISTNKFILDYYKKNPESEWKIKAILQYGFPFEFIDEIKGKELSFEQESIINVLKGKEWSIFVFSKNQFPYVTIGFNDRYNYANLALRKEKIEMMKQEKIEELPDDYKGILFCVWDSNSDDDQDREIQRYLFSEEKPLYPNNKKKQLGYYFTEVPVEFFRIDYLDYLSRYKESVVKLFGLPDKNEKIERLGKIIDFVGDARTGIYNKCFNDRKPNIVIKDFFFQKGCFKPMIYVGEEQIASMWFPIEYEIHTSNPNISSYYLYCLLTSEFIADYYYANYSATSYNSTDGILPIEDCFYIKMSPEKMNDSKYKKIYEYNVNSTLKVHNIITAKKFNSIKIKEIIEKYLVEIKNDIDAGSLYSAAIVMGSVLEAILIDWLGEIDGKDYFKEDYYVINPKTGNEERASFYDYIEIMKKKRPDWLDKKSKMATEIRKKRNLVHPKLYIEEGEISVDLCNELLEDLETIVRNRWSDER